MNEELYITEALRRGIEAHKAGETHRADSYYTAILAAQPKHPDANHNMGILAVGIGKLEQSLSFFRTALEADQDTTQFWMSYIDTLIKLERLNDAREALNNAVKRGIRSNDFKNLERRLNVPKTQDPAKEKLQEILNLYSSGQLQQTLNQALELITHFPKSPILYNICGVANASLGQLDNAIVSYEKAIKIKPDYADAYNNLGNTLRKQGKLDQAVKSYEKAIKIKPDYNSYANLGNTYNDKNQLGKAAKAYEKAISIKPDFAEAYNNLGVMHEKGCQPNHALEAYNKAISINPNTADSQENFISLHMQINNSYTGALAIYEKKYAYQYLKNAGGLKYQILHAVKAYLDADFDKSRLYLDEYLEYRDENLHKLSEKDKIFCSSYFNFLKQLLEDKLRKAGSRQLKNHVYHLGESHCLSFAHNLIKIGNLNYEIKPLITFGAKAYHFSKAKNNIFKAITKISLSNIPNGSNIFLSFGEIDCRPDQGFILASKKLHKPIQELIENTVNGYLSWFEKQIINQTLNMNFFNIPAPIYDQRYSHNINQQVASVVALYNSKINGKIDPKKHRLIDVYKFTVGEKGFSNGFFHIDNRHLSKKALVEIEKQINEPK